MSKQTLTIKNKASFIKFLTAASGLYEQCIIHCNSETNILDVFVSTESEQVILYSEYSNIEVSEDITMNVPDLKKLIRMLALITLDEFVLNINNNSISYSTPSLSFKYHLYEDGIIRVKKINKDLLKNFKGEHSFAVSGDMIDNLIKQSSVLGNVEFVYIRGESGKIICNITDKKIPNVDNIENILLDTGDSSITFNEMKFSLDNIRLLTSMKCANINWQIHTKYNCIVSTSKIDDCVGYYSITALI